MMFLLSFSLSVSYLVTLSALVSVVSNDGVIDGWWTGKDGEGSGCGFEVVSQNFPGGTGKNMKTSVRIAGVWARIWTRPLHTGLVLPMFQLLWLKFLQNQCGLTQWQISGMGMSMKLMKLKTTLTQFCCLLCAFKKNALSAFYDTVYETCFGASTAWHPG